MVFLEAASEHSVALLQTYEATLRQLEEAQSAKETEERQLHDKVIALREELKFKEDLITKLVPAGYRAKVSAGVEPFHQPWQPCHKPSHASEMFFGHVAL